MAVGTVAQNTITVGTALGWTIALLNFAALTAIGLIVYIYNQDKKTNQEKFAKLEQEHADDREAFYVEIRSLEKNARQELKTGMEDLEKHLSSRMMEAMTRIEDKLESISKDTKKISNLEQRVATAVNDIDWLKRNAK